MEACESAAGTASRILSQSALLEDDMAYDDMYRGRGLSRRNSVASLHSLHARSRSRPPSPFYGSDAYGSTYGSGTYADPYTSTGSVYGDAYADPIHRHRSYSSSVPINGSVSPYVTGHTPSMYAGSTAAYSPYNTSAGYAMPMASGYASSYPSAYGTTPNVTIISPPSTTSSHHSHKHRHRSSSRQDRKSVV